MVNSKDQANSEDGDKDDGFLGQSEEQDEVSNQQGIGDPGVLGEEQDEGELGAVEGQQEEGDPGVLGEEQDEGELGAVEGQQEEGDPGVLGEEQDEGELGAVEGQQEEGDPGVLGEEQDEGELGAVEGQQEEGDPGVLGEEQDEDELGAVEGRQEEGDPGVLGEEQDEGELGAVEGQQEEGDPGVLGEEQDEGELGAVGERGEVPAGEGIGDLQDVLKVLYYWSFSSAVSSCIVDSAEVEDGAGGIAQPWVQQDLKFLLQSTRKAVDSLIRDGLLTPEEERALLEKAHEYSVNLLELLKDAFVEQVGDMEFKDMGPEQRNYSLQLGCVLSLLDKMNASTEEGLEAISKHEMSLAFAPGFGSRHKMLMEGLRYNLVSLAQWLQVRIQETQRQTSPSDPRDSDGAPSRDADGHPGPSGSGGGDGQEPGDGKKPGGDTYLLDLCWDLLAEFLDKIHEENRAKDVLARARHVLSVTNLKLQGTKEALEASRKNLKLLKMAFPDKKDKHERAEEDVKAAIATQQAAEQAVHSLEEARREAQRRFEEVEEARREAQRRFEDAYQQREREAARRGVDRSDYGTLIAAFLDKIYAESKAKDELRRAVNVLSFANLQLQHMEDTLVRAQKYLKLLKAALPDRKDEQKRAEEAVKFAGAARQSAQQAVQAAEDAKQEAEQKLEKAERERKEAEDELEAARQRREEDDGRGGPGGDGGRRPDGDGGGRPDGDGGGQGAGIETGVPVTQDVVQELGRELDYDDGQGAGIETGVPVTQDVVQELGRELDYDDGQGAGIETGVPVTQDVVQELGRELDYDDGQGAGIETGVPVTQDVVQELGRELDYDDGQGAGIETGVPVTQDVVQELGRELDYDDGQGAGIETGVPVTQDVVQELGRELDYDDGQGAGIETGVPVTQDVVQELGRELDYDDGQGAGIETGVPVTQDVVQELGRELDYDDGQGAGIETGVPVTQDVIQELGRELDYDDGQGAGDDGHRRLLASPPATPTTPGVTPKKVGKVGRILGWISGGLGWDSKRGKATGTGPVDAKGKKEHKDLGARPKVPRDDGRRPPKGDGDPDDKGGKKRVGDRGGKGPGGSGGAQPGGDGGGQGVPEEISYGIGEYLGIGKGVYVTRDIIWALSEADLEDYWDLVANFLDGVYIWQRLRDALVKAENELTLAQANLENEGKVLEQAEKKLEEVKAASPDDKGAIKNAEDAVFAAAAAKQAAQQVVQDYTRREQEARQRLERAEQERRWVQQRFETARQRRDDDGRRPGGGAPEISYGIGDYFGTRAGIHITRDIVQTLREYVEESLVADLLDKRKEESKAKDALSKAIVELSLAEAKLEEAERAFKEAEKKVEEVKAASPDDENAIADAAALFLDAAATRKAAGQAVQIARDAKLEAEQRLREAEEAKQKAEREFKGFRKTEEAAAEKKAKAGVPTGRGIGYAELKSALLLLKEAHEKLSGAWCELEFLVTEITTTKDKLVAAEKELSKLKSAPIPEDPEKADKARSKLQAAEGAYASLVREYEEACRVEVIVKKKIKLRESVLKNTMAVVKAAEEEIAELTPSSPAEEIVASAMRGSTRPPSGPLEAQSAFAAAELARVEADYSAQEGKVNKLQVKRRKLFRSVDKCDANISTLKNKLRTEADPTQRLYLEFSLNELLANKKGLWEDYLETKSASEDAVRGFFALQMALCGAIFTAHDAKQKLVESTRDAHGPGGDGSDGRPPKKSPDGRGPGSDGGGDGRGPSGDGSDGRPPKKSPDGRGSGSDGGGDDRGPSGDGSDGRRPKDTSGDYEKLLVALLDAIGKESAARDAAVRATHALLLAQANLQKAKGDLESAKEAEEEVKAASPDDEDAQKRAAEAVQTALAIEQEAEKECTEAEVAKREADQKLAEAEKERQEAQERFEAVRQRRERGDDRDPGGAGGGQGPGGASGGRGSGTPGGYSAELLADILAVINEERQAGSGELKAANELVSANLRLQEARDALKEAAAALKAARTASPDDKDEAVKAAISSADLQLQEARNVLVGAKKARKEAQKKLKAAQGEFRRVMAASQQRRERAGGNATSEVPYGIRGYGGIGAGVYRTSDDIDGRPPMCEDDYIRALHIQEWEGINTLVKLSKKPELSRLRTKFQHLAQSIFALDERATEYMEYSLSSAIERRADRYFSEHYYDPSMSISCRDILGRRCLDSEYYSLLVSKASERDLPPHYIMSLLNTHKAAIPRSVPLIMRAETFADLMERGDYWTAFSVLRESGIRSRMSLQRMLDVWADRCKLHILQARNRKLSTQDAPRIFAALNAILGTLVMRCNAPPGRKRYDLHGCDVSEVYKAASIARLPLCSSLSKFYNYEFSKRKADAFMHIVETPRMSRTVFQVILSVFFLLCFALVVFPVLCILKLVANALSYCLDRAPGKREPVVDIEFVPTGCCGFLGTQVQDGAEEDVNLGIGGYAEGVADSGTEEWEVVWEREGSDDPDSDLDSITLEGYRREEEKGLQ